MPQIPVDQIFQQDPQWLKENYPQIYSNYVQQVGQPGAGLQQTQTSTQATQAEIPGIQAKSTQSQIQAQQAGALQNLKKNIDKGMTLKSALSTYTALGMKPDDIFSQYLAESPYGLPKESPQELQELGITPQALGQIGTPGSFMDRYNTRNAIASIRDAEGKWNQTNALGRLEGIIGLNPAVQSYKTARQVVGNHLSTLIPGAPGAQATAQSLLDLLPDANNPTSGASGVAGAKFTSLEDQLLKTKGYSYKDLGLGAPQQEKSGKDLLSTLLGNSLSDVGNLVNGAATEAGRVANATAGKGEINKLIGPTGGMNSGIAQFVSDAVPGVANEYASLATHPLQHLQDHPVNTALDVLPFLSTLRGATTMSDAGEAGASASSANAAEKAVSASSKLKGNPILDLVNPQRVISRGGNFRDVVNSIYDKAGTTINGDKLASDIRNWADKAKMSNLPDRNAIEEAAQNAEQSYKGKTFTPSQVQDIYDGIEKGYTKGGEPRSATSSYIDRGLQDVLGNNLNEATEGNWNKAQQTMAKGYGLRDSGKRKFATRAAASGLGLAGLDELRKILGIGL